MTFQDRLAIAKAKRESEREAKEREFLYRYKLSGGAFAMNKVKEIQCTKCSSWHSVEAWNDKAWRVHGILLDVENEKDQRDFGFRCPRCNRMNNMTNLYTPVRYRHSLHGMDKVDVITDYHPAQIAADIKLVNILIEEATQQWERRQEIEEAIDRALDQRDEAEFYRLTNDLMGVTA
jgi:DNA-directed RNA polymerase subunit RPC12/RpoP